MFDEMTMNIYFIKLYLGVKVSYNETFCGNNLYFEKIL